MIFTGFESYSRRSYFMNFFERAQGAAFTTEFDIKDKEKQKVFGTNHMKFAAALGKGKFARNKIQGVEGNQGPYKLSGNQGESYIIVLAGYRRRLSSRFLKRYHNRIINLYPGDTTKDYLVKGVDAAIQAINAGEAFIQCTVFLQKENERFGPALLQSAPISLQGFTEDDRGLVNEKIREEGEWIILPYAVHNLIAKGCLGVDGEDNLYLEGVKLEKAGLQFGG